MTAERWKQVTDLFHAALERDAGDRVTFLDEATTGDPDLRREVESLLAAHATSSGFLETPAWGVAPELILDDEEDSLVGRTVGPYQVLEEIGRGGMGVVYAAEDTRLGRQVALKALARDYASDHARRERLRREARAAAALTHPSIATIYALEEIDGSLYIVSELVRGRTLREELADGPLPPARLRHTLIEIADAMAAAHARGIVHRDLKPENIMRAPDERVKILDFGLARSTGSQAETTKTQLTQVGQTVGTPGYMAPEQLSGGEIDARTDIFAFGVVATELATGEHPFGPDSASMLRRMTLLMEGKTLSASTGWSAPELEPVVRRCLRAAPEERYGSGEELLIALREASIATPPTAPSFSGGRSLWWWQFHQVAIAVTLAAMPAIAWGIRRPIGTPWGSRIFFAALVLATVSITARMNLLFTSTVDPGGLPRQRCVIFPWVAWIDAGLAGLMIAAALMLEGQDAVAGLTIALGTVILASVAFIEPATTRSAGL